MRGLILAIILAASLQSQDQALDWKKPSYWGLKKSEYIPGPGCFTGSWGHKKYAYEICTSITYASEAL